MCHSSLLVLLAGLLLAACGPADGVSSEQSDVTVFTGSSLAWQQYLANVRLALDYQPACALAEDDGQPRVLVTGFGRFGSHRRNATGLVLSALLDELDYPETDPPPPGEIDPPGPQTRAATGSLELSTSGRVHLCAMVLPVFWDLAAVLALREIAAFEPDLVIMNGVAGARQPLWLELGAVNRAAALPDGSGVLTPATDGAPLVATAPDAEYARPSLLSWLVVRDAVAQAIGQAAESERDGVAFGEILDGVRLAGYPRASNTYLCNNVTYTVGYLMDHPGEPVRLLEPSEPRDGYPDGLELSLADDHRDTPRAFVHWPSELDGAHLGPAAEVLATLLDAQLAALDGLELPTRGDNALADLPPDGGGDTY